MKAIGFAIIYALSLIPGIVIVALGQGHWSAWVLGVLVSSGYYRFFAPREGEP